MIDEAEAAAAAVSHRGGGGTHCVQTPFTSGAKCVRVGFVSVVVVVTGVGIHCVMAQLFTDVYIVYTIE